MTIRIAIPDMISPSYFPAIAAVELGMCEANGVNASIELVFPITRTYEMLRDDEVQYVGGASHAALYAFEDWKGVELLCALSQHMYWFLVVRTDLGIGPRDVEAVKGLKIGAAPGPVDGLRLMLADSGLDPDTDVEIGPIPAAAEGQMSFGIAAAEALRNGLIDGFWANGMGAEVAVDGGHGTVVVDARRGDGPDGTQGLTFSALAAASLRVVQHSGEAAAVTRSIIEAQLALTENPSLAEEACKRHFPKYERSLISELIARDSSFYQPTISAGSVEEMNAAAHRLGLLSTTNIAFADVVSEVGSQEWTP